LPGSGLPGALTAAAALFALVMLAVLGIERMTR